MKAAIVISVLAGLGLSAVNVVMGPLNQDEGWYLLAGLNTASGLMPYRDYFFTQGPVLPYVYGWLAPLWAPAGVLGGRVVSAVAGLLTAGFCAGLAARLSPPGHRRFAALLAWLMTAVLPTFSYFTSIPKTYALSGLFISTGFFVLAGRRSWRFELCGVLLALAAGTRLSLGILLAVVGFGLLALCRREGFRRAWLRFGLGGGSVLVLLFAPFAVFAFDGLLFSQSYHAARTDSGWLNWLVLRVGFVSRLLQGYYPLVLGGLLAGAAGFRGARRLPPVAGLAALGFIAVTAIHLIAPFPYDDYQTPVMPLAAALVGVLLTHACVSLPEKRRTAVASVAVLGTFAFAVASPLCMEWVVVRQDRFWFQMKDVPDVIKLRQVGARLRADADPGRPLLTQDAYLAVEAGMRVVPGLEMGPFSLFPNLDDETARRVRVHTVNTLMQAIESSDAEWAALSGYAFAVSCPTTEPMPPDITARLRAAVADRYEPVASIPDFGQGHTELLLYRRPE